MDIVELQRWSFIPELPTDIGAMRELLQNYSKIPAEEIDRHLIGIVSRLYSSAGVDNAYLTNSS